MRPEPVKPERETLPTAAPPVAAPAIEAEVLHRVRAVELLISTLLLAGVAISLFFVVAGTLLTFIHHPGYVSSPHELQRLTKPGAAFPHTPHDVLQGVLELRGQAITTVGLLLLIATPVMRVAVSIFAFVYQRDRTFVAITTMVLLLLLLSLVLGKGG